MVTKEYFKNYQFNRRKNDHDFYIKTNKLNSDSQKKRVIKYKLELMNILGGPTCNRCGFTDIRALQFDHIKGNGKRDYKRVGKGITFTIYYRSRPKEAQETLQVLCANCNWIKRHENNENRV